MMGKMPILDELPTPSLILDLDILERNLDRMAARARRLGVALRPHIKTHKCLEIGRLQRERGATGLTVSTLEEARAFADAGFEDLFWAFPAILSRLEEIHALAARITLRLVVDAAAAIEALEKVGHPFHVWLKVDCGYHRAGVDPHSPLARELAQRLASSPCLVFDGILSHSGHAYAGRHQAAVRAAAEEERRVMVELAAQLRTAGIEVPAVSIGSTPAMAVVDHLEGVDEVRPGNYVFYDRTQVSLGSCGVADCALSVLSSVVSAQPDARHGVIDAGALALSKDPGPATHPSMGAVLGTDPGELRRGMRLTSLSQEHGIVGLAPTARLTVGERLRVLPNHSCLTAACFDSYAVVRGTEVVDRWRIWRQR